MQIFSSTLMLAGIIGCVLIAALGMSAAGGALAGQNDLNRRATQTTTAELDVQFNRGMDDLNQGNYALAAERFRWILQVATAYPNAASKLTEAESAANQTKTPVATLAPSTSQNPEELFTEAKGYYDAGEWANAISRFQDLQIVSPTYHSAEVKEMLYRALVTLGLQYVRGDRLQEGLTLLDQASAIKPLDDQAEGERNLATLYITGRTYVDLNWSIAIENFQAIYADYPTYRDVKTQLWDAHVKFGDQLAAAGAQCDAADQYAAAIKLRRKEEIVTKYDAATEACANPTPTPGGDLTTAPGMGTSEPEATPAP